jgi:hypothetical protein
LPGGREEAWRGVACAGRARDGLWEEEEDEDGSLFGALEDEVGSVLVVREKGKKVEKTGKVFYTFSVES